MYENINRKSETIKPLAGTLSLSYEDKGIS